jgi:hypothetical protein
MFINSGLNKFFNYMPMPENMDPEMMKDIGALMEISWLMPLIGFAEVVGGILIVLPKTKSLGRSYYFPGNGRHLTYTLTCRYLYITGSICSCSYFRLDYV